MENVIFEEIKGVNWEFVRKIAKLERRNLGREASINQWVIPVIVRYGKFIVAKKNSTNLNREKDNRKRSINSDIIGVCELIRDWKRENAAFIHSFYIDKKYRNKGIGKKFLDKVINILKSENFKVVELTVSPDNKAASQLYEKFGFRKIDVRKNEYGRGVDRYLMRLEL